MIFNLRRRSHVDIAVYKSSFIEHVFIWVVHILFFRLNKRSPIYRWLYYYVFPLFHVPVLLLGGANIRWFFSFSWCHLLILCLHSLCCVVICSTAMKGKLVRILRGLVAYGIFDREHACALKHTQARCWEEHEICWWKSWHFIYSDMSLALHTENIYYIAKNIECV